MSATSIFEKTVDLNSLFTLTYNFDLLKQVLEGLVASKNENERRIRNLENQLDAKEDKILSLEEEMKHQNNITKQRLDHIEEFLSKNDKFEKKTIDEAKKEDIQEKTKERETPTNISVSSDQQRITPRLSKKFSLDIGGDAFIDQITRVIENSNIFGVISKKIKIIEDKLEETASFIDISDLKKKIKANEENIDINRNDINHLKSSMKNAEETLEELKVKVLDFNIYDIFKNNGSETGEGGSHVNTDEFILLLKNLENKVFKKLELQDDRLKKNEETILKNDTNLKNQLNAMNKTIQEIIESIQKNATTISKIETVILENRNYCEAKEGLVKIPEYEEYKMKIAEELDKIRESLNGEKIISKPVEDESQKQNKADFLDSLSEMQKTIKDLSKRASENEKNIKLTNINISSLNIESLFKELEGIRSNLMTKANGGEIFNLKELINQLSVKFDILKESTNELAESKKMFDDVAWMRKKIENLNSIINTMKTIETDSGPKGGFTYDMGKYVEQHFFQEHLRSYNAEIFNIHKRIDELKRALDDVINGLRSKVSDKDLKNLEIYLVKKLDEAMLYNGKKFSDKQETNKSIKYLESQIRSLIEITKKSEKGDNWLLAKKPIDGHFCASCENYLGELNDSTEQHVYWNKYPAKEHNDKLYRLGNGFSKMLNLLTMDAVGTDNKILQTSTDFYRNTEITPKKRVNKKDFLPRVKPQKLSDINNQSHDSYHEMEAAMRESISQPKIVNIYKRVKHTSSRSKERLETIS